jgi:hypothetical protein
MMLTYDDIETMHSEHRFKPGTKEYHAVRDFIDFRRRYQRGLTDPIYGLQAMDDLRAKVDEIVNPRPTLADDLAAIQLHVRHLREDCRNFAFDPDTRLNKIEAMLGDAIAKARGEK